MSGKVVKALYPFKGTNNDELSFRSGDKITLTQQDPEGWWEGTLNGKTGWFPCNYVEEITSDAEVSQVEPLPGLEATWATNRGEICKELIASEKKFIAELNKLRGEYLGPLRSTPLLTPSEFAQLSGNLDALIGLHTRLLDMALDTMASPPKDTRVGGGFLQLAPSLRTAYLEYCRRHPNAVALLDKYRDELNSLLMRQTEGEGGIVHLTAALSAPFRRIEKYAGVLQELAGYMEDSHCDRGDASRAAEVMRDLVADCTHARRQRELELELLSGNVQNWEGEKPSELGDIQLLSRGKVQTRSVVSERYLALFPRTLVLLSTSPTMNSFVYEGSLPLSGLSLRERQETGGLKVFELKGPLIEPLTITFDNASDSAKWSEGLRSSISDCLTVPPESDKNTNTLKEVRSQSPAPPPLPPQKSLPLMQRSLPTLPPRFPALPRPLPPRRKHEQQLRKDFDESDSSDAQILRVIESYCLPPTAVASSLPAMRTSQQLPASARESGISVGMELGEMRAQLFSMKRHLVDLARNQRHLVSLLTTKHPENRWVSSDAVFDQLLGKS